MSRRDLVPQNTNLPSAQLATPYDPRAYQDIERPISTSTIGPSIWGFVVILLGLGLFVAWSALAPLASAVIAPGVLIVEDKRKEVEHLEGGLIRDIRVKEGQEVRAGDVLLVIESVASTVRFNQLVAQERSESVRLARIEAEFKGQEAVDFGPVRHAVGDDPEVTKLIALQAELFDRRRSGRLGQLEVFNEQISQIKQEITGIEARLVADRKRLKLTRERLEGMSQIFRQGHATRPQVAALEGEEADLEGSIAENRARIAGLKRRIAEVSQQKTNLETDFLREVTEEYQEVTNLLADIAENKTAASDVVERMNVVAPIGGKVVGMNINTEGAVISGGEKLMEIVPDNRLVVETLIRPEDIEQVHPGQSVLVRLTAFNFRTMPPVRATLTHVSADRVIDERSGVAAYHGKIELDAAHLTELADLELYPGMPAEAIIQQSERTFVDYLAGPVIRVFERGLRDL